MVQHTASFRRNYGGYHEGSGQAKSLRREKQAVEARVFLSTSAGMYVFTLRGVVSPSKIDVARSRVGHESDTFPHRRVEGNLEREAQDVGREELSQRSSSRAFLA